VPNGTGRGNLLQFHALTQGDEIVAARQAPMNAFDFTAALAPGATLVTPNKRLARHFVTGYDKAQLAAGRRAWVAGRAMPWQGWLQSLWLDALAADALPAPRVLVGTGAAAHLFDRVVAQESPELLDAGGASADAAEAWSLFHAWRLPDDRFEGWSHAGIGDDAAAFARWAQRYRAALAENGLIDAVQLADRLAACATRVPAWRKLRIVTIGFIEFAPQQRRLLAALRDAGAEIVERTLPRIASSRQSRVVCATPEAELGQALAWARDRALANPGAEVAIVVADLASRRAEVAARAEDILCPALASQVQPDAPRPYDISLGIALADVPMIATAIDLIALGGGALPMPKAAALLRSAHLPGAEERWTGRAMSERRWRERGPRKVTPADIVRMLDASGDPLAATWRDAAVPARGARSPAQWASDWRAWLAALGWPGTRPLGSGEWQAGEAWSQLLATFGTFAGVTPMLARDDALAALRSLAARTVFQPEAPPARIRIMGLLEASGLVFDALWIAGMNADSWPPAQAPHPMLPLAWQRERRVPRSDAARDLAHVRVLTDGFGGAASEVVASHARQVDGLDRAESALVAAWPELDAATLPPVVGLTGTIASQRAEFATCGDENAPPLAVGSEAGGGVGIIESQSSCPFQAFARYRLRADAWPVVSDGLTPQERGLLLHAALAALWDDIGDHATLVGLDEGRLGERIAQAVTLARAKLDRGRWQSLPAAVAAGESQRLADTVLAWLDAIERARPPFAVRATEMTVPLTLGGIGISMRIDRIDALADGGVAVIDYKSGRAVEPAKWFAPRPSGTQVGLYALALRAMADPPAVRAAVYAQMKAGEIAVKGLAADADAWPALKTAAGLRNAAIATWADIQGHWARQFGALAKEFARGAAHVAPRDAQSCAHCDLHALCRIQSLDDVAESSDRGIDTESGDD
jgi:ATP-dependent helicase/nuclease subunit B